MKTLLLALAVAFSGHAFAQSVKVPGDWKKIDYTSKAIPAAYLDTQHIERDLSLGKNVRVGMFMHEFRKGLIVDKKVVTHGLRAAVYDCDAEIFAVIKANTYNGDVLVSSFKEEDIVDANSHPLYIAEMKAICSVPEKNTVPLKLKGSV